MYTLDHIIKCNRVLKLLYLTFVFNFKHFNICQLNCSLNKNNFFSSKTSILMKNDVCRIHFDNKSVTIFKVYGYT